MTAPGAGRVRPDDTASAVGAATFRRAWADLVPVGRAPDAVLTSALSSAQSAIASEPSSIDSVSR